MERREENNNDNIKMISGRPKIGPFFFWQQKLADVFSPLCTKRKEKGRPKIVYGTLLLLTN